MAIRRWCWSLSWVVAGRSGVRLHRGACELVLLLRVRLQTGGVRGERGWRRLVSPLFPFLFEWTVSKGSFRLELEFSVGANFLFFLTLFLLVP